MGHCGVRFQSVKCVISGGQGFYGQTVENGSAGYNHPSSLVLLPIEGRRSPWRRPRNAAMVSGGRCCFIVIKVLFRGFSGFCGQMVETGSAGYNHPSSLVLLPIEGRRSLWRRPRNAAMVSGGKACANPGRCHATKCLLRRQTESQRDPVHPWSLAGVWWIDGADGIAPGGNVGKPVRSRQRARMTMTMTMRMIFKRAGTRAGGEIPGRRCGGGTLGPARTLILWGQPMAIRDEYGRDRGNRVVSG